MGTLAALLVFVTVLATVLASTQGRGSSDEGIVVETAQGRLRGSILISRKGRKIYSFRGVRFAQPPIGKLRFKAPVPPEPWNGIRNATEDGFGCPQPVRNNSYATSEDCLFLNVYSTALTKYTKSGRNPNRPVMVFFHSGGFYFNTGVSVVHGPQYLLDQDIVLVTTNYRLAALGFLSTDDDVMHGNYGMKDQVATLRWVQQNIAAFGGNPKDVTIAGCSAGGASVWLHMVSPMSRGLFHKGILQSMGLNTLWDINQNPLAQAKKQATILNCPNDTSIQIADCLRKKDAQEIADTFVDMYVWAYQPSLQFSPVIEKDFGQERFLTEDPMKTYLQGNFVRIPWMAGMTKNELDPFFVAILLNETLAEEFYERFEELAPVVLGYEEGTERSRIASQTFKKFYLHNRPITNSSLPDIANMVSDAYIRYAHDMLTKLASDFGQPVYSYQFEYRGRYSHEYIPGTQTPFGVIHHDDLIYLYFISDRFPEFGPEDPESLMVEKMTTMWANFITTGNPTPRRSALLNNVIWNRMTRSNLAYLSINTQLEMKSGLYQDRMAVWDKLFPANSSFTH